MKIRTRTSTLLALAHAVAAAGSLASPATAGDAPGGVVFTGDPRGSSYRAIPHAMRVRRVGTVTLTSATPGAGLPMPVIGEDGALRFHWRADPPEAFPETPADAADLRDAWVTADAGGVPWMLALRTDGRLVQWGSGAAPHDPGIAEWRSIAVGHTNVVGIASDGTVQAWSSEGPLAIAGMPGAVRTIALARRWGVAVHPKGTVHAFGLDAAEPGAAPAWTSVVDACVVPTIVASAGGTGTVRVITSDGAIRSLSATERGTPLGDGPYVAVRAGTGGTIALRADGSADFWAIGSNARRAIPGSYTSVAANDRCSAVWSTDADRNGTPDAVQALDGSIPDANGDLIDDRFQRAPVLMDLDADGRADAAQTGSYADSHVARAGLPSGLGEVLPWYWFGAEWRRTSFLRSSRVRPGATQVDRVSLPFDPFVGAPDSLTQLEMTLHVWSDPNQDGHPSDLEPVAQRTFSVQRGPASRVVAFEPIDLGAPGQSFFFGISRPHWELPQPATGWATYRWANSAALEAQDAAAQSRVWNTQFAAATANPTVTLEQVIRGESAAGTFSGIDEINSLGFGARAVALIPVGRRGDDCDGDGALDSLQLAHAPELVDANGDGRFDACDRLLGDLNNDGVIQGMDLGMLLGAWGAAAPGASEDLNGDGAVDGLDLGILLGNWGALGS